MRIDQVEYLADYLGHEPPPPSLHGALIAIPAGFRNGAASASDMRWVRATFNFHPQRNGNYGIYLPRASPSAAVYLNGVYLGGTEGLHVPRTETWNYPYHLAVPAALLREGANELLIEIVETPSTVSGDARLGRIWVGPEAEVYPLYQGQLWRQVTGVELVSLLVGLIGMLAGVLWWRRRSDTIFGLFALCCGLWLLRNTQFFLVHTYVSAFTFAVITDAAMFWLVAVLFTLSFRILERPLPRSEAALYLYALLATIALAVAGPRHSQQVKELAYTLVFPLSASFLVYLTRIAWRERTVLNALLWLAAMVTSLAGAYDLALMLKLVPWPAAFLLPYSALFFAVTVGWALIDRFVMTHNRYERLNAELESRVRLRERELSERYARVAQLERDHAIASERDRILRDMHDGLGLQLISSMRLVETRALSREQISALLTEAMDELRIAIDSVKPTSGDLLLMLGNLRYRLEPRLNAAGITLRWDIGEIAGLERLGAHQITELTRIVQEAITNAMKHAAASELHLSVTASGAAAIEVCLADNGHGFDLKAQSSGEGLASMRSRAERIGGQLAICSRPGMTCVRVTVPLDGRIGPAPSRAEAPLAESVAPE